MTIKRVIIILVPETHLDNTISANWIILVYFHSILKTFNKQQPLNDFLFYSKAKATLLYKAIYLNSFR